MKEYKINDYIILKLEDDSTVIYINNSRFIQCKKLVLDVSIDDIPSLGTAESMDDVAKRLKKSIGRKTNITPEDEFWGHCSNIQAWVEYNYNTDLLHTSLSFPLLRELVRNGDPIAKEVLKDEILHRLILGEETATIFLLDNDYLEYFTKEEISTIYKENLLKFQSPKFLLPLLRAMVVMEIPDVQNDYKKIVKETLIRKYKASEGVLIGLCHYLVALEKKELIDVFEQFRRLKNFTEGEKFRVLDILMHGLQFDYGGVINFRLSDVAKILLVDNEQNPFLDIVNTSDYPYIQEDFSSDEVRQRSWEDKLYFETFRGHVDSIEIDLDRFNEKVFYRKISNLKNFLKLEVVNLLCWSKYDSALVKQALTRTKSIKLIQIYDFFKDPPNFV